MAYIPTVKNPKIATLCGSIKSDPYLTGYCNIYNYEAERWYFNTNK